MYRGSGIVGTVRDGRKVPMLVFVFDEGLVILESTDAELLASNKTLKTYKEFEFWQNTYEPSAKRLDFAEFSAQPMPVDTLLHSWPQDTVRLVRWYKEGGFFSQKVLRIERSDGSPLDLVLYAVREEAELVPLRDFCKKAFGSRYMTR